jgi:hypothetical protein
MPTYRNDGLISRFVKNISGQGVVVTPGASVQTLEKLLLLHPGEFTQTDAEPRLDPAREVEALSLDATSAVVLELLDRASTKTLLSAEVVAGGPATAGVLDVDVRPHGQEGWQGTDMTIDLAAPMALVVDAPVSAIRLRQSGVAPASVRYRAVARQF